MASLASAFTRSLPFLRLLSCASARRLSAGGYEQKSLAGLTLKRDEEPNGTLVYPLADTVTGALLDSSYEGGVINDTIEHLARGRVGDSHSSGVGSQAVGKIVAAHRGGAVQGTVLRRTVVARRQRNSEKEFVRVIKVAAGYQSSRNRAVESRSQAWSGCGADQPSAGRVQGQERLDMRWCRGASRGGVSVVVMAQKSIS